MTAGRLAAIGGGVQRGCRNVAGTLAFGAGKTAFVTTLTANQPGGGRALVQGEAGTLSDSQHRRLAQDRPSLTRLGAALVSSLKNSTFYGRPPSRGPSTCGSRFSSR